MQPITFILIWVIVWWMTWFTVLSVGLRQGERDTDSGAPDNPRLIRKAILVTVGSFVFTAVFVWLLGVFGPQLREILES